jgi:hypothetical protein
MGLKDFFKKPKSFLTDEDNLKLREIKRQAYLKEAEKLVEEQGKLKAQQDLGIKKKETF